jgi:crossover junction endodeoxyribonuclease RuvC
MRVLAIDPGYGRCGVAILEKQDGKDAWLYSDCIETDPKTPFAERLHTVASACEELIETFSPDAIAIEKLFFNTNQKTAIQVAEVRGALLHVASARGVATFEYTPMQVKSATTGSGRADKKQIIAMIHLLLPIQKKIVHDDEYDAIAIGITHCTHAR